MTTRQTSYRWQVATIGDRARERACNGALVLTICCSPEGHYLPAQMADTFGNLEGPVRVSNAIGALQHRIWHEQRRLDGIEIKAGISASCPLGGRPAHQIGWKAAYSATLGLMITA